MTNEVSSNDVDDVLVVFYHSKRDFGLVQVGSPSLTAGGSALTSFPHD
jgi:hypothetical protein